MKIPTSRSPSQTPTEPTFSSSIRAIATLTVSSGETLTTRKAITSATGIALESKRTRGRGGTIVGGPGPGRWKLANRVRSGRKQR